MGASQGQVPKLFCIGCYERDQRIAQLQAEVRRLQEEAQVQQKLHQAQVQGLQTQVTELSQQVQDLARSSKRQAAPFSKGPPKSHPKKPGRKPGRNYGTKAHRPIPHRIDQHYHVPLPGHCSDPNCQGRIQYTGLKTLFQVDLPLEPIYRQFDVECGRCLGCHRAVCGRHPLQTSQAVGCCASQLGAHVQALLVLLNKELGLSHAKSSRLMGLLGIRLTAGGVCQAVLRAGAKSQGTYQMALERMREEPWIVSDETGWRIGGLPAWLHVAVSPSVAAYVVARNRGREGIGLLLGEYEGKLVHDGFAGYDWFCWAEHQTCTQHLLRRCQQMLLSSKGKARDFVLAVRGLLKEGLGVRDARDAGQITPQEALLKAEELEGRLEKLVQRRKSNPANETFARHLRKQRGRVFVYLKVPGLDATNWRAELALRFAVVNRKVWGGNRTGRGAEAQGILQTVLKTARVRGRDDVEVVRRILCEPQPHRRPALLLDSS